MGIDLLYRSSYRTTQAIWMVTVCTCNHAIYYKGLTVGRMIQTNYIVLIIWKISTSYWFKCNSVHLREKKKCFNLIRKTYRWVYLRQFKVKHFVYTVVYTLLTREARRTFVVYTIYYLVFMVIVWVANTLVN